MAIPDIEQLPPVVRPDRRVLVRSASGINHGPVRVHNLYHFAYADGTPFVLIGTTCYAWTDQPDDLEDETLETLKHSPFDKVRMSLLPGKAKPIFYPYEQDSSGKWREDRFNVDFFRHLEKRIQQLGQEGIQADLILFNPYHKGEMQWFDNLDDAGDDRYTTMSWRGSVPIKISGGRWRTNMARLKARPMRIGITFSRS